ncbi:2-oxo acid dehydrogenase subunit E2 [Falsiroseomonas selenitidurans]|uniref:2-oxo acid dehydrogenase subunit E2 n=1 Tax=Falsiroseomonas selenitidurans TaxID=2716335 RepID=A0ABX1EBP1_9PROT|nr:2-oxo acid dehydrogenase subunit E2 [Falsiroseomonas selenitidurans]NKC32335.1 2-oxo acid dehydrogenase subunit E2 [Falsiroseomonas selenitidurans]
MTLRRIRPSPGRQTIADLSWASLRVPRCTLTARLRIPRALAGRTALPAPRPPWTVLFTKAFALVAEDQPSLRRLHATLPSPRLLEAPHAVGCVVLERLHQGVATLALARFTEPHATPIPVLAQQLHHAKTAPPGASRSFHRLLRFARLPWPLRRLMLRFALATAAPLLRYGGTFAISALGRREAAIVDSVSVLPCFLSYGPIDADGGVAVFLSFDHRVMDGADGAAALEGLEAAMESLVADELAALAATPRLMPAA